MALSNLERFNRWTYSSMVETITQQIALFNAATRGAIVLRTAANTGDYADEAYWKRLSGLVRRRDAYGSGAVASLTLEHLLKTSVKVAAGTPPVSIDPGMMTWIQQNPDDAGIAQGRQLAEGMLADILNTALGSASAAIGGISGLVHDATSANLSLSELNIGASKMGDRAQDILAWVMHSKPLFDLYGAALTNSNDLFSFGTVRVVNDGFGRPLIMTDSSDLSYVATGTKYHTLGLVAGGIVCEQNNDFIQNTETKNGDENILRTVQSEWSYNVGIKGFSWDKASGGASPTDAELTTATNWDTVASSIKDNAGVIVNSQ
jgi:hypothetical protein